MSTSPCAKSRLLTQDEAEKPTFTLLKVSPGVTYILKSHKDVTASLLEINLLNLAPHPALIAARGVMLHEGVLVSKLDVASFPLNVYCVKNNLSVSSKLSFMKQILNAVNWLHEREIAHLGIKLPSIAVFEGQAKLTDSSLITYEKQYLLRAQDVHDYGVFCHQLIDPSDSVAFINSMADTHLKDLIKNFTSQIFVDETVRRKASGLLQHALFSTVKTDTPEGKKMSPYALFPDHRDRIKMLYRVYSDNFDEDNELKDNQVFFCAVDMLYRVAKAEVNFEVSKLCLTLVFMSAKLLGTEVNLEKFKEVAKALFDVKDLSFLDEMTRDVTLKLEGRLYNSWLFDNFKKEPTKCISSIILAADSGTYIETVKL